METETYLVPGGLKKRVSGEAAGFNRMDFGADGGGGGGSSGAVGLLSVTDDSEAVFGRAGMGAGAVVPEGGRYPAVRGSRRVMVTEDTAGMVTGAARDEYVEEAGKAALSSGEAGESMRGVSPS